MRKVFVTSFVIASALQLASAFQLPSAAQAADVCATPDQAIEVKALYSRSAGLVPSLASRQIDVPEVAIASALPAIDKAGTSGKGFAEIWATVTEWEDSMTLIQKEGHVYEIMGAVPPGKRSERSNYFNLEPGAAFGGHIRDDQMSAIYAIELPGRGGDTIRSIHFYDQSGTTAFSVLIRPEAGPASEDDKASFAATMALVKSMEPVCP